MYYPFMVKNYQLLYFQFSCSLSFLFSLPAWGLCTLQVWIFLNEYRRTPKSNPLWGEGREAVREIHIFNWKAHGIMPKSMTNYSTAASSSFQTSLPSVTVLWFPVTALVLGNSLMSSSHGLTKNPCPLISTVFGFLRKVFETSTLFPFYEH